LHGACTPPAADPAAASLPQAESGAAGEPRSWTRQPADTKPAFSVSTLRKAIPAHCFQRSLWRSSAYLLTDLAMLAGLVYASSFIDSAPLPAAVRWLVLWPLYWFFAGAVATGLWVRFSGRVEALGPVLKLRESLSRLATTSSAATAHHLCVTNQSVS
jgi:hypothetical protein